MFIKRLALTALGVSLLAACGQQDTAQTQPEPVLSAQQPAAQRSLGLYELRISSVNGKVSTQVVPVGKGLSAQEVTGLSFSASAAQTVQDATGKHYSAAITVTNGSGRDLRQPLYVPVAVTGYTQNGTFYTNAQDSSGNPTDPTGVSVEQADAGTPLVSTSVSPSLISVPSGMTVSSVSPQAWQTPALPNGAQQTVTFGFNIPDGNPTYSFSIVFSVFDTPAVNHLVISQVYGGGESGTATFKSDYVELFNPTNSDISLNGLSLQYAAATNTGNFATVATLPNTSIKPGAYYLVRTSTGTAGADIASDYMTTTKISIQSSNAKVALVNGTTAVSSQDPLAAIDFVGFGTANTGEGGTKAPAPSVSNAIFRAAGGCQDTDNNAADFTAAPAAPRNSATAINLCQ